MKLYEAMLLGSAATPKSDGYFYNRNTGGTCALGAAVWAIGQMNFQSPAQTHLTLPAVWPDMMKRTVTCPECGVQNTVQAIVPHLNNSKGHNWTREAIAEWLKPIELGGQSGERTDDSARNTERELATSAA